MVAPRPYAISPGRSRDSSPVSQQSVKWTRLGQTTNAITRDGLGHRSARGCRVRPDVGNSVARFEAAASVFFPRFEHLHLYWLRFQLDGHHVARLDAVTRSDIDEYLAGSHLDDLSADLSVCTCRTIRLTEPVARSIGERDGHHHQRRTEVRSRWSPGAHYHQSLPSGWYIRHARLSYM